MFVADIEELETMDASEIYSQRLNAKEVIFPKENGKFVFPAADGRITLSGCDQELRILTLTRDEEKVTKIFLENLKGSLSRFPMPVERLMIFGPCNFIYRHHVEPRVKLQSPRDESFPIPLKYVDVSRTTHTNLDVKQEKRIDDYWNIDGSRDLFHSVYFIGRKTS